MTRNLRKNRTRLYQEATLLEEVMAKMWLGGALPGEWSFLDDEDLGRARKKKVSLYVDEDVVRWFRGLGAGYQTRIADVLRIYARAMQSGELRVANGVAAFAPEDFGGLDGVRKAVERVLRDMAAAGQLTKELLTKPQEVGEPINFDDARAEVEARLKKLRAFYAQERGSQ